MDEITPRSISPSCCWGKIDLLQRLNNIYRSLVFLSSLVISLQKKKKIWQNVQWSLPGCLKWFCRNSFSVYVTSRINWFFFFFTPVKRRLLPCTTNGRLQGKLIALNAFVLNRPNWTSLSPRPATCWPPFRRNVNNFWVVRRARMVEDDISDRQPKGIRFFLLKGLTLGWMRKRNVNRKV
ncbi:hypothetical protein GHT06_021696 [Daphnia sinensis]|uniref:Uncharacterized protein n=1 Tax=Daphnia sinensis TaxID=1820382 RepID=A0AAD5KWQ3_9CRUS|nr:hypothetical protein GHT06_021696 [Daphnia sinensis]